MACDGSCRSHKINHIILPNKAGLNAVLRHEILRSDIYGLGILGYTRQTVNKQLQIPLPHVPKLFGNFFCIW